MVEVDPADFIDPVTGEFDTDAYLAALAAANNQSQGTTGGTLPITGSNSADVAAVGLALVAVGGAAVVASSRRRKLALATTETDDIRTTTGN